LYKCSTETDIIFPLFFFLLLLYLFFSFSFLHFLFDCNRWQINFPKKKEKLWQRIFVKKKAMRGMLRRNKSFLTYIYKFSICIEHSDHMNVFYDYWKSNLADACGYGCMYVHLIIIHVHRYPFHSESEYTGIGVLVE
jgi:hypothetical protein